VREGKKVCGMTGLGYSPTHTVLCDSKKWTWASLPDIIDSYGRDRTKADWKAEKLGPFSG
jgi:hypothetical protein